MRLITRIGLLIVICSATHVPTADALTVTIDAWAVGSYSQSGLSDYREVGYIAGTNILGEDWRNYFVFDLSNVTTTVTAATLMLNAGDINGLDYDSSWLYQLRDVTTPIPDLVAGTAGVTAWLDFGDGILYGEQLIFHEDIHQILAIALNAQAVEAINAAGDFALGGALVFPYWNAFTDTTSVPMLALQAVPEPTTALLLACGLAGLAAARQRQ